jgi:hypothetical protein
MGWTWAESRPDWEAKARRMKRAAALVPDLIRRHRPIPDLIRRHRPIPAEIDGATAAVFLLLASLWLARPSRVRSMKKPLSHPREKGNRNQARHP